MACSNLIIAHDNPFNREVLRNCGFYFKTPSDLAATVNLIDAGQSDSDTLRLCAVTQIRDRYRWDQIAEAYLDLLR